MTNIVWFQVAQLLLNEKSCNGPQLKFLNVATRAFRKHS